MSETPIPPTEGTDEPGRVDEVFRSELINWLLTNGFAEHQRGYGHASGAEIAAALIEEFEIRFRD